MFDASIPLVLLVDDDARNLLALETILDGAGYQIVTAQSGVDALRLALRTPPTVVLLDVLMPEMDGYEVARTLKTLEQTRDIPILFLTALATELGQIYRAYEVGAVDYLIKPLDPEVVRRKVAVFVDLVRQRELIERQASALREAQAREHALRVAELRVAGDRRYHTLVEGIDHAVGWTMNAAGRLTFVSRRAAWLWGYGDDDLAREGFWERHSHPEDAPGLLAMFRRAMDECIELSCNHRMIRADGSALWFHTGVSGERVQDDGSVELHGLSVDVTDIKRAEEDAQRTMQVRERIVAIVAHDLRSPLSAIGSASDLLDSVSETVADPGVRQSARAIRRAVDHMDRILEDLLDLALIEAGRLTIEKDHVDAGALIREALEMLSPVAAAKGLRLEHRVPEALGVDGDPHRLTQVLSNLIGNAVKFTPEGGTVCVAAHPSGDEVLFTIADSGPGLSEEATRRMWDPWWQGERAASSSARDGVGLGLSIAHGLVTAHEGRIWAKSEPGGGTTVHFTIPRSAKPPQPGAGA